MWSQVSHDLLQTSMENLSALFVQGAPIIPLRKFANLKKTTESMLNFAHYNTLFNYAAMLSFVLMSGIVTKLCCVEHRQPSQFLTACAWCCRSKCESCMAYMLPVKNPPQSMIYLMLYR